jgi:dTDP-4-amino-4,6-dideoxygalactose transaminase
MTINVTKTYLPCINKFTAYVNDIYQNAWMTNNGPLVNTLEKRLEEYLGVKNLVLVSNGSMALHLAYKLLGLSGEVITVPFSFVATTSTLVWDNLTPVFVDVDTNTLNINPALIEEKITEKTSAILPVHVFGNVCDVEALQSIAEKHNLKLVYDAAHAFGVTHKGESVFNFGDISTVSFHATKLFHSIEGGALIIKDDSLYEQAKCMINFGMSGQEIKCVGTNFKMNEFQAAMGLAVLDDIDKILEERKAIWMRYFQSFDGIFKLQSITEDSKHNYHYFPVIFESERDLVCVQEAMNKEDIYPRRYFYPSLNTLDYLSSDAVCKVSEKIASRILCFPIYPGLTFNEQSLIIDIVDNVVKRMNS